MSELSSRVRFRMEIKIQFRKRVGARVKFKDGEKGQDRDHGSSQTANVRWGSAG